MSWDTRRAWSGETPASQAVLLQRFDQVTGSGPTRSVLDATGRPWTIRNWGASTKTEAGRWGNRLVLNDVSAATEQTSLTVPHFPGMWPSSGKVLLTAWAALIYSMSFSPIISTRNTAGKSPLVYLSTVSDGRPRAQVYSAAGTLLLDQSETLPWTPVAREWVCYMLLLDMDAKTSQLGLVRHTAAQAFVAPVRTFTGDANPACTADFEVATLSPTAAYWSGAIFDEVGLAHPGAGFDFATHVESVRRSCWARGARHDTAEGANLTVTDYQVTATGTASLDTGAEHHTWTTTPVITLATPITGTPLALLSTDNGATWSAPSLTLPASFTGLVRWRIPLAAGETFRGLALSQVQPAPAIDPIPTAHLDQHSSTTVTVTGTWTGSPTVTVTAPSGIVATVTGTTITIHSGPAPGEFHCTVTVTDGTAQTATAPLMVHVDLLPYEPPATPVFAQARLVIHDANGDRAEVITHDEDSPLVSAVISREINGEETLTFSVPAAHPKAFALVVERGVEAADAHYRIRRLTRSRDYGVAMIEAYCEAPWYDLRTAGRVLARDFSGATAAEPLTYALAHTGWALGDLTVATRRTWTMEGQTALAALRAIGDTYGGDIVFDSTTKTVSLVQASGRDRGVAFFRGAGLTDATRVEDTTMMLTRIEPRNEEGIGIEAINGGLPYLDDFSFTNEVKHGIYNFSSGASPQTMMAMTLAALGKRARPTVSYEATISDLSAWSGQEADRFDVGDFVLINDEDLGISTTQRIVRLEYDMLQPWASKIVLSEKLRELGSDTAGIEAGLLTTGTDMDTRDLVPDNLLRNARFDNGLAGWASSGAVVVDGGATGTRSVRLGPGTRWIEQTVATDTRDAYVLSVVVDQDGGPTGWVPDLQVVAEIVYTDGERETITLDLA